MFDIKEEVKSLPKLPGVYIIKNSLEEIIYVGKAISLKNRVSQYFQSQRNHPPKVKLMVKNTERFEYIITDTEVEALILEANLIKKHKPKYNIVLRDDKQYPYIKIDLKEKYPRLIKSRDKARGNERVFGPYTNVTAMNIVIEIIGEVYKLRTCNLKLNKGPVLKRPCLNYFIDKCLGPCFRYVEEKVYDTMIEEVLLILEGKHTKLISEINKKMIMASEKLEFELAAEYRDRLEALKIIVEKQKIDKGGKLDQDIVGIARGATESCVQVFFVRNGKIIGREHYLLKNTDELSKEEIITSFLKQFYITSSYIPKEIVIEEDIEEREIIEQWLLEKNKRKVVITIPQKGDKVELLSMVKKNAFDELKKYSNIKNTVENNGLDELQKILKLIDIPKRIEAYDISNTQGINSVGAMAVFVNGKPSKKDYRKFKVKLVTGPDDYSSLEEILERRFRRGIEEMEQAKSRKVLMDNFSSLPNLIVMDGGKGQVSIGKKVIEKFNLDIPICGLVKDEAHKTRGIIFNGEEIEIKKNRSLLKLLSKIQDEVHRFAIGYHREIMEKNMIKSELDLIKGVGSVRKKSLLSKFGSISKIRTATLIEIENTENIDKKTAVEIYKYFNDR